MSLFDLHISPQGTPTLPTAVALTDTATLTAEQSAHAFIVGIPTAAATYTTATAAEILDHLGQNATVGSIFLLVVSNQSAGAFAITLAGGTGVTIVGADTTAQDGITMYLVRVEAVDTPAVSVYQVGASS